MKDGTVRFNPGILNPNIVKVPNVYVQGETGGFEGPAAILGASNLMQSIGGSKQKQSTMMQSIGGSKQKQSTSE